MKTFRIGHDAAGRIICVTDNPERPTMIGATLNWIEAGAEESPSSMQFYVVDAVLTPRPANPATLTGNVLNNLPVPCIIYINSKAYVCDESVATLRLDPGEYRVAVTAWPYQDAHFTVRI